MKKSFKKVLAVVMCVAVLLSGTSIMSFAATSRENLGEAVNDWINAISSYTWDDFFGFVTAILGFFGFQGSFEGVHSLPELVNEWFEMLGPIGEIYENFINSVTTSEFLAFLMGFLA
ncbi:MAG: hypothetical protein IJA87_10560 [Clostridia bacterium]|nr:hypothetical protein [Clostridia bacterium]